MKRFLRCPVIILAMSLSIFSLAACNSKNDTQNNTSQEITAPPDSKNTTKDEKYIEAVTDILKTQIYYYELACYGMEYSEGADYKYSYNLPRAITSYLYYNGIEDSKNELAAMGSKVYWGMDIDKSIVISVANDELRRIDVKPTKVDIQNDTAEFFAEIYLNDIKIYDTHYTFYSEKISEEMKKTPFNQLAYQDSIWKIKQVEIIRPEPITEITEINSIGDFIRFVDGLDRQERNFVNGRFVLNTDIDLSSIQNFKSIGTFSSEAMHEINADSFLAPVGFNGFFDGQGHTISGFNIEEHQAFLGFFNTVNEAAVIKNLNLKGNVTNLMTDSYNMCTGGFAGIVSPNAIIENCTFTGNVDGKSYTGGFVGRVDNTGPNIHEDEHGYTIGGKGYIKNCSFTGDVVCYDISGGFAGNTSGAIKSCTSNGNVIIDKKYAQYGVLPYAVGGFCGSIYYTVEDCFCNTRVTHYVSGANRMGNFAGELGIRDVIGCTISSEVVNPEWRMIGFKDFTNTKIDIKQV